jgi:hypothetical protein
MCTTTPPSRVFFGSELFPGRRHEGQFLPARRARLRARGQKVARLLGQAASARGRIGMTHSGISADRHPAESSCGVRQDFIGRIRRLLADAAQQADWPLSCTQGHPRILGIAPINILWPRASSIGAGRKVFAAQRRPFKDQE